MVGSRRTFVADGQTDRWTDATDFRGHMCVSNNNNNYGYILAGPSWASMKSSFVFAFFVFVFVSFVIPFLFPS